jgi:hypothetical protein
MQHDWAELFEKLADQLGRQLSEPCRDRSGRSVLG